MRSNSPSRRRLAALLLAGACAPALLAPTAASAIDIPSGPKIQHTQFRVSLVARQTTTWVERPAAGAADCTGYFTTRGRGKEVVTARTTRPLVMTAWRTGSRVEFLPGALDGMTEQLVAVRTNRSADVQHDVMGCGDDPAHTERGGANDCGPRAFERNATLEVTGGRMALDLSGETMLAPLTRTGYDSCPIHANSAVAENGITRIGQSFPAADLLAPNMRKHIVLASRTYKLAAGRINGSTTVRWEITLVRTKAINRIGI